MRFIQTPAAFLQSPALHGAMIAFLTFSAALAQDVLTYHNNNSRTGFGNQEKILTHKLPEINLTWRLFRASLCIAKNLT